MAEFTVVIPYRPRRTYDSLPFLLQVIESINVPILISVYGEMDPRLENVAPYIHTQTEKKWNRSKAINIGVDHAETEWVFANDADCIWDKNVKLDISNSFDNSYHVVYRVIVNGELNNHGAGMQGYSKTWPIRWDERYEGYGREDIDMYQQAKESGLITKELSGGITHLNHPRDTMPDDWKKNKDKFNKKWK